MHEVTFILKWNADAPLRMHKANYRKEYTLVVCTFCAFLNYPYIPRLEVLTAVLLRIRRRVGGLVVPGSWKERADFIFKGDVWLEWRHVTSQMTWILTLILLSVNTNHARSEVPTAPCWLEKLFYSLPDDTQKTPRMYIIITENTMKDNERVTWRKKEWKKN